MGKVFFFFFFFPTFYHKSNWVLIQYLKYKYHGTHMHRYTDTTRTMLKKLNAHTQNWRQRLAADAFNVISYSVANHLCTKKKMKEKIKRAASPTSSNWNYQLSSFRVIFFFRFVVLVFTPFSTTKLNILHITHIRPCLLVTALFRMCHPRKSISISHIVPFWKMSLGAFTFEYFLSARSILPVLGDQQTTLHWIKWMKLSISIECPVTRAIWISVDGNWSSFIIHFWSSECDPTSTNYSSITLVIGIF